MIPSVRSVLLLLAAIFFLQAGAGGILQWAFGEAGLAVVQLGLLLVPALLFVVVGSHDPVATLSLRRPARGAWFPALILMVGAVPVAWFIAWGQSHFIEIPSALFEAMSAFMQADGIGRFLWLLFLVAILPALAEEVLFRGVLLSALRGRFSRAPAVLLNGLIFGLFHASPQTAFRILPTAWLGVILAWVVWETRSLWMGVLLHFLNNATVLVLSVIPLSPSWTQETDAAPPAWLAPLAMVFLAMGVIGLARRTRLSSPAHAPASVGSQNP